VFNGLLSIRVALSLFKLSREGAMNCAPTSHKVFPVRAPSPMKCTHIETASFRSGAIYRAHVGKRIISATVEQTFNKTT